MSDQTFSSKIKSLLSKYRSVIAYLVLGACTTAVNVTAYFLCYRLCGIANVPSTIIAWTVAVAFAFVTNKPFVFGSRSWAFGVVYREAVKFFGCRLGTGVLEVVCMYVLVDLSHFDGTLMKLLVNIVVVILNFVLSKWVIFRKKR